ncbi:unnamed protein product [Owenia fusiformis]|uniref:Uncharacterized protein n=1 Tax=Owenia fusiformis TaxID=6347 RepID=A0A8S4Q062_OWEFU|nr:unnamed protein product [Owenia fusiformis]
MLQIVHKSLPKGNLNGIIVCLWGWWTSSHLIIQCCFMWGEQVSTPNTHIVQTCTYYNVLWHSDQVHLHISDLSESSFQLAIASLDNHSGRALVMVVPYLLVSQVTSVSKWGHKL